MDENKRVSYFRFLLDRDLYRFENEKEGRERKEEKKTLFSSLLLLFESHTTPREV